MLIQTDESEKSDKLKLYLKNANQLEDAAADIINGEDLELAIGTENDVPVFEEKFEGFEERGSKLILKEDSTKIIIYPNKGKVIFKAKEFALFDEVPENSIEMVMTIGNYRYKIVREWKVREKSKYVRCKIKNESN